MKKLRYLFLPVLVAMLTISCDEDGYDDYNPGNTPATSMSGEWYIDVTDEATGDVLYTNALHRTYDDNNGGLFVSDRLTATTFSAYEIEAATQYDLKNLTFGGNNLPNTVGYESAVTITEGKIIKNGARTESGAVVDSIYFKAVFDYDPENTIIYAGHGRTGFVEDEH
jgi:hypothetical protein